MVRVTKREIYLYLGMVMMLFPIFLSSFSSILFPGIIKHMLWLGAAIFVLLYAKKGLFFQCNKKVGLLLILVFCLIYYRSSMPNSLDRLHLPYLCAFVYMLILHPDDTWWGIFWKVIRAFCLFHLVTGVILLQIPGFQINYIVPLMRLSSDTYYRVVKFINQGYMTGLTYHYSTMGMYMALGVISFAKPLFPGNSRVKKKDWFLFSAFLIGLILSGKRGPFLFAIVALSLMYWVTNKPFSAKQYRKTFLLILTLLIVIPLAYYAIPQFQTLIERFLSDSDDLNDMSSGRVEFYWLNAIAMFLEKPFMGYGWRSFRVLNQSRFAVEVTNDVHNIYLQLAAETGIIGLTVFLMFFSGAFSMAYKALKYQKKFTVLSQEQTVMLKLAMTYQVYFLLYGFTGNPLYDAQCYIPYFLCCTIGYSAWYKTKREIRNVRLAGASRI